MNEFITDSDYATDSDYTTDSDCAEFGISFSKKAICMDSDYASDSDNAELGSSFSEETHRSSFIRELCSILMVQFAITVGFIYLFKNNDSVRNYTAEHPEMMGIASFMALILMIARVCCDSVRRTFPLDSICLFLYAFVESFQLGVEACAYEAEEIMWTTGICAFIFLGLTAFAFQTKYDFTMMERFLFVALLSFFIFEFFVIFLRNKIVQLVYALIFSMFLIGGDTKYSISPEDSFLDFIHDKCKLSPAG